MEMTFHQYIQNPMGKENAVMSNRNMYRELYEAKLDKIMVREMGKITFRGYSIGTKYLAYIKIPSEVVPKFYYDVLIEFTPSKKIITNGSLEEYNVRFFSNDPSFVYTFAHAFIKNDLFIKAYSDKMSKEAIQKVAKEKNPNNQVGYVKSLYFAYLIMKKRGYFNKLRYVDPYSEKAVKKEVMHADEKIKARQEAAKSTSIENKKARQKEKELSSDRNTQNPDIPISKITNKLSGIKNTKMVKATSKTISKIKTVKKK